MQWSRTNLFSFGAIVPLIIIVVFCHPHENFMAVSLSGNMTYNFGEVVRQQNDKLCSATVFANRVSVVMTRLAISTDMVQSSHMVNCIMLPPRSR